MTQNKCLHLYLIIRGNTTLAQLKPNLYSIYWLLLSYKITSWRDTHPTSKFFVCAEGLISCYLSSLTVSASLHFLPCEKNTEHYFFQMPRFCLIIKHFSPMVLILRNNMYSYKAGLLAWYTAISRKVVGKNVHATIPKGNMGYEKYTVPDTALESTFVAFLYHSQTYVHGLSCHSFKFLWRTVNSKPPTIPFGIVACTFVDNLSQNSCIQVNVIKFKLQASYSQLSL